MLYVLYIVLYQSISSGNALPRQGKMQGQVDKNTDELKRGPLQMFIHGQFPCIFPHAIVKTNMFHTKIRWVESPWVLPLFWIIPPLGTEILTESNS